jgi:cysteinyl-tRNA synthetase
MIRKILTRYFGYDVFFCQNITDIDDKIIERSNKEKVDFAEFDRKWEMDYWDDM